MRTNKQLLMAVLPALLVLNSCTKQEPQVSPTKIEKTNSVQTANDYGVSVTDGRLKFASIEDYLAVQDLDANGKNAFIAYVEALPNFTSVREAKNETARASSVDCDCLIDDEFVNSVVDAHYMVQIDQWLLKLNGCTRMVYALDLVNNTQTDIQFATQALINCDFVPPAGSTYFFYVYTFDHDVLEEIEIARDSLNGNPNARGLFCNEVAISNRWAEWPLPVAPFKPVGDCMGIAHNVPHFELAYNNNGINGVLRIDIPTGTYNVNNWPWRFDFHTAFYRTRCQQTYNTGPFQPSGWWNPFSSTYRYIVHSGKRLTNAPTSTAYLVKARIKHKDNNCVFSDYIQIIP